MNKKVLRYGMVGGGIGAFIGAVHRTGAEFDGLSELSAGCFSRDFENTKNTCKELRINPERGYETFEQMAVAEGNNEEGIDFVIIVTPNNTHYPIAKAFLEQNISVVCDKPLTLTINEAEELESLVRQKGLLFGVTYANQGYPMVKQARQMVSEGIIGDIRMIMGEYPQSWLADRFEESGAKILWRLDPKHSGVSNCVADIGSHLENLVSYITGLEISSLCAKLDIIGEGRKLDTNGRILVDYHGGGSGIYWCSQIAVGHENALRIRIMGTKGSIEWAQEDPNYMLHTPLNGPTQRLSKGNGYINESGLQFNRIPPGHPDGTYEAFANIYRGFCEALLAKNENNLRLETTDYPDISQGVQGMKFIHTCVESSNAGSKWMEIK